MHTTLSNSQGASTKDFGVRLGALSSLDSQGKDPITSPKSKPLPPPKPTKGKGSHASSPGEQHTPTDGARDEALKKLEMLQQQEKEKQEAAMQKLEQLQLQNQEKKQKQSPKEPDTSPEEQARLEQRLKELQEEQQRQLNEKLELQSKFKKQQVMTQEQKAEQQKRLKQQRLERMQPQKSSNTLAPDPTPAPPASGAPVLGPTSPGTPPKISPRTTSLPPENPTITHGQQQETIVISIVPTITELSTPPPSPIANKPPSTPSTPTQPNSFVIASTENSPMVSPTSSPSPGVPRVSRIQPSRSQPTRVKVSTPPTTPIQNPQPPSQPTPPPKKPFPTAITRKAAATLSHNIAPEETQTNPDSIVHPSSTEGSPLAVSGDSSALQKTPSDIHLLSSSDPDRELREKQEREQREKEQKQQEAMQKLELLQQQEKKLTQSKPPEPKTKQPEKPNEDQMTPEEQAQHEKRVQELKDEQQRQLDEKLELQSKFKKQQGMTQQQKAEQQKKLRQQRLDRLASKNQGSTETPSQPEQDRPIEITLAPPTVAWTLEVSPPVEVTIAIAPSSPPRSPRELPAIPDTQAGSPTTLENPLKTSGAIPPDGPTQTQESAPTPQRVSRFQPSRAQQPTRAKVATLGGQTTSSQPIPIAKPRPVPPARSRGTSPDPHSTLAEPNLGTSPEARADANSMSPGHHNGTPPTSPNLNPPIQIAATGVSPPSGHLSPVTLTPGQTTPASAYLPPHSAHGSGSLTSISSGSVSEAEPKSVDPQPDSPTLQSLKKDPSHPKKFNTSRPRSKSMSTEYVVSPLENFPPRTDTAPLNASGKSGAQTQRTNEKRATKQQGFIRTESASALGKHFPMIARRMQPKRGTATEQSGSQTVRPDSQGVKPTVSSDKLQGIDEKGDLDQEAFTKLQEAEKKQAEALLKLQQAQEQEKKVQKQAELKNKQAKEEAKKKDHKDKDHKEKPLTPQQIKEAELEQQKLEKRTQELVEEQKQNQKEKLDLQSKLREQSKNSQQQRLEQQQRLKQQRLERQRKAQEEAAQNTQNPT